jgi:hypothetical protein
MKQKKSRTKLLQLEIKSNLPSKTWKERPRTLLKTLETKPNLLGNIWRMKPRRLWKTSKRSPRRFGMMSKRSLVGKTNLDEMKPRELVWLNVTIDRSNSHIKCLSNRVKKGDSIEIEESYKRKDSS